jgi:phosphoglycerate dehydrogenase-like enzyme
MNPRVLLAPAPMKDIPYTYQKELEGAGLEIVYPKRHAQMTEPELLAELPGCVATMAGSETYTPLVIEKAAAAGLKVIARAGVGYDGVDVAAATAAGVIVTYAPGTNHEAVAEHALMLMLAVSKNLIMQHDKMRAGGWPRIAQQPLRGRKLGIVGLGRTGKAVAVRAQAFQMPVIAHDPYVPNTWANERGIPLVGLEQLFRESDLVSLHVPLTPETKQLIRTETLNWLKPTAYLINTARGGVVNEADLHAALASKRIAGAGLDVFVDEPPVGSPLLKLDNVVLTAHTAGVDVRSREEMANVAAQAIAKILGEKHWPADWIVNPEVRTRTTLEFRS